MHILMSLLLVWNTGESVRVNKEQEGEFLGVSQTESIDPGE